MPERQDDPRRAVAALTQELYRQATAVAAAITAGSGMHPTDVAALRALDAAASAPVSVSALGAQLGLSSGAMTALVDRLEGHGMVSRERDPGDRRRVHVVLTPKARELGREVLAPIGRRIQRAVADLDDRGAETVSRFLGTLVETSE